MKHSHTRAQETPATLPQADAPRLLLAEDDSEMRCMLSRALRRSGFHVTELRDGRETVSLLSHCATQTPEQMPHLLISDVRMPGCTGLEVLAHLRRSHSCLPVILITSFGDEETHEEARRLGAAQVIDKPFDLDELCAAAWTLVPAS
ncbi:response regulator [Stigmatella aurantiaca]|nr:response regulator [Stigmatella aurantiaca]EAU65127.1 two-component system, regulatory protein [Stigmatella aurantiaca DW4/3-1]